MRLGTNFIFVLLSIVLSASGWSGALASTVCSHSKEGTTFAASNNDHECCPVDNSKRAGHCNPAAAGKAPDGGIVHVHTAPAANAANNQSTDREVPLCDHCLVRSAPVPVFVNLGYSGWIQRLIDIELPIGFGTQVGRPTSFYPPIRSRQGAPPFSSPDKQILFSIFLI